MRLPRISSGQAAAVIAMLALAGGSYWLRSHTEPEQARKQAIQPPPRSDYYARNARITVMDAQGRPVYILNAASIRHYPDESADMDRIRLHYMGNRGSASSQGNWRLRANHGHRPSNDSEQVQLHGNVVANGQTAKGVPLTLHTPSLTVFMQEKRLATAAPVRVDSRSRTITAVGMRADLKTNKLHFLKNVHAQFTP